MEKYEKTLTHGLTYEKLYRQNEQNIWFLAWVLKQRRCNPDFNQEILSAPFTVQREYLSNGQLDYLKSYKNCKTHGLSRIWHRNGQLSWETKWQNGLRDGLNRGWHRNGQLSWKDYWLHGQRHGFFRSWDSNGQLLWEEEWQTGQKIRLSQNL